jgi:hypothetical protein
MQVNSAAVSSAVSRASLSDAVSLKTTRLALDQYEQQGRSINALIASANEAGKVAARAGSGGANVGRAVDVYA